MMFDKGFLSPAGGVHPGSRIASLLCVCLLASSLRAQNPDGDAESQRDHDSKHTSFGMGMVDMTAASMSLMNLATGTSANAAAWRTPMLMAHLGSWNTMFMGTGFIVDTQQSGPRGGDKFYSPNWFMSSAEHRAGERGAFQADLMLSLDPATITGERYPLLFQTGETAYGRPIVDGQHPHNFVMSLGFHYVYQLSDRTTLSAYFAPVGDPALGPVAFPHRASATELPQATLSHHWQDSTHVADDVVTVGISHRKLRLEASGFHGSEPGENRWVIQSGRIDSWAARLWFFPSKNWAAQVSAGRIAHPEALQPGDQVRATASLQYIKAVPGGSWASTVVWGRDHSTATFRNLNSFLAESVFPVTRKNLITGRAELVDKDELFAGQPEIEQRLDSQYGSTFRIGSYTAGYTRDVELFRYVETGLGANFSFYSLPDAIKPYYGHHPAGGSIFIRIRLRAPE